MSSGISVNGQHDWLRFASLSGEAGRLWAEEYSRSGASELTSEIDSAVLLLRRRRLREARVVLGVSRLRLQSRPALRESIANVLRRWYSSALAYERYCSDALDEAHELLYQAQEEVRLAIERCSFLISLADHCYDFQLQRARIERNRRRWGEVKRHIEIGRAMIDNLEPLCLLSNGSKVYLSDVDNFYRSVDAHEESDRLALAQVLDEIRRRQMFETFVRDIYVIPGFVIPYP